jgi:uncharacterized protein with von Willebrand factor type A (vWA) domain
VIDSPDRALADVDLAELGTRLADRARAAGVPVTVEQINRFTRAVLLTTPARVEEVRRVARVTLARSHEQVGLVDGVVGEVFGGHDDIADHRGDATESPGTMARRPPLTDRHEPSRSEERRGSTTDASDDGPTVAGSPPGDDEGASDRNHRLGMASRNEQLASTDFADLSDAELRELYALMQCIRVSVPLRPARRRRRHRHGDELDLRATLRHSRRHGGEPLHRITRRPQRRPRPLVVLCDISGSMAPYSRACVQLLHAANGAAGAEVFTFATRLTRLTRALAVSDPDRALARAAATAPDWRGGTRIGAALKAFLDEHGRRGVARGAVVVIVSDGWDLDDPELVGEQMARLRRLAHRIVWVNPRAAAPEFQPLAGAMAAALPWCDQLVSGHTLVTLAAALGGTLDARRREGPLQRTPQDTEVSPRARAAAERETRRRRPTPGRARAPGPGPRGT